MHGIAGKRDTSVGSLQGAKGIAHGIGCCHRRNRRAIDNRDQTFAEACHGLCSRQALKNTDALRRLRLRRSSKRPRASKLATLVEAFVLDVLEEEAACSGHFQSRQANALWKQIFGTVLVFIQSGVGWGQKYGGY